MNSPLHVFTVDGVAYQPISAEVEAELTNPNVHNDVAKFYKACIAAIHDGRLIRIEPKRSPNDRTTSKFANV